MNGTHYKDFTSYLVLERVALKTRQAYLNAVAGLHAFHEQPPENLSNEQIQDYLIHCIQDRQLAWSSCNVLFCGLKKYYKGFLGRDESSFSIPPRTRSRKVPMLLSREEVLRLLQAPSSLKHRALLTVIYGSGLRVSEAVSLRPIHIESKRMMLRVEQGKGRKDRYTILSQTSLHLLREYWRHYQPHNWLFFGRDKEKSMPKETAQKIYYQAKEKAGITNGRGIHTLRHCFASHALDHGVQLFILKRWLGHSSLKTTCTYLHTTEEQLAKLVSPLDKIKMETTQ
jgi:site-specific recombinase XerD